MTKDEVIQRIKECPNRAQLARDTGLPYMWLYEVQRGTIKNPGSIQMDKLRDYFSRNPG